MTDEAKAKELRIAAYSRDVSLHWDVAFAEAALGSASIDDGATVLVAQCRDGAAIAPTVAALPNAGRIMACDNDRDFLNIARKSPAPDGPSVFFNGQGVHSLQFADNVFGLAICPHIGTDIAAALNAITEMQRVVAPSGRLAAACVGSNSFSRLRELLTESVWALGGEAERNALDDVFSSLIRSDELLPVLNRMPVNEVFTTTVQIALRGETSDALLRNAFVDEFFEPLIARVSSDVRFVQMLINDLAIRAATYFNGYGLHDQVEMIQVFATVADESVDEEVSDGSIEVVELDSKLHELDDADSLVMAMEDIVELAETDDSGEAIAVDAEDIIDDGEPDVGESAEAIAIEEADIMVESAAGSGSGELDYVEDHASAEFESIDDGDIVVEEDSIDLEPETSELYEDAATRMLDVGDGPVLADSELNDDELAVTTTELPTDDDDEPR